MTRPTIDETRRMFRDLHGRGTFVLPNPWDVGSARLLESMGFVALATTSSGLAAALGRPDGGATRDDLVAHVAALTGAVGIPVAVDAERCFAPDPDGVADTVEVLAAAGAAGVSIEDWNPQTGRIDDVRVAVERVAAAATVCDRFGMVLTGRCENLIHGVDDLDDTISRLIAYRAAGAGAVHAPGVITKADIARVVTETQAPVNVLALPGTPPVPELAELGVRRVSTGGGLAWAAYGALVEAARELQTTGTCTYVDRSLPRDLRGRVFTG